MDSNFLHTFLLVVDTGSMAEAARRLNITAGAVAQQIHALERELAVELVARAGRTVKPTDAGSRVVERARALVKAHIDLKDVANGDSISGELKLGAINTALQSYLPGIIAHLARKHPQMRVVIRAGAAMELYDAVLQGDLDAAICIDPQFRLPKVLGWRLIREEPLVVLAPRRFANREPHELLQTESFIRYARSQWGGRQAEHYLRAAGIAPRERFELSSLTAIALMVDRGLGVSLVPDAALLLPGNIRLAKLRTPLPSEPRRIGVVWSRSSVRTRLIKLFLQAVQAVD
ncbi:MAG: LysR family transcriptional regulator [Burkholderiales bacterium]|nr:LysR family transcriptional regulator [Burkholderiales bacterium]